ncbi:hypothetical protein FLA105534_04286 [Flavobacterium bizetiae]|uniref:Insecticide toxin TcdB middle/N-terminal domain-containing protein n=1 Tax=Flavobacterium bizetiae TaxID=2704140 RepID=A0A6J4GUB5_9FLAO|nr:RHS repeat-associated core domain-containing protein [Flavobacterium bizetiae]CAA9202861.1 hypothetical protein FLA105534_04286 [Flavobacterium bizetiae]CAD5343573.1 hypothetical protein FLA105535_03573 [Flavobacterium bizetiae]CAD5349568.1 hypothetical protein FLA105534_03554 [Flavobacterium bizetiae]
MKQLYFLLLFLIMQTGYGQNFTDTKGELQISAAGTATYNLPIAVPPSIKNVAPIINLSYSSGVRGGLAGQGWTINSISTISRIATRRDIDGYTDGVDFDADDKLALDGQRLLIKTGVYWASGSTYQTEYKSNSKIELIIEGTTTYFIVTSPDGSRSWYGSKGSGSLQNSASVNSWYIVRYEDVNGNFIDYNYTTVTYNNTTQLYIDNIVFSGNATAGIAAQDKISFIYKNSSRVERDYIKGGPVYATKILDYIQVYASSAIFRTYKLSHTVDSTLGYDRLTSVQEINAQNEVSNPVIFQYSPAPTTPERTEKTYTNNLMFDKTDLAGDFDGDGRLDFVAGNQIFTNLFTGDSGNAPSNFAFDILKRKFTGTTLSNNKMNQFQSIIIANPGTNTKDFQVYNLVNNALQLSYTKTVTTDTQELQHLNDLVSFPSVNYHQGNLDYCTVPQEWPVQSTFVEGDFNGDGISEMLIINPKRKWYKDQKMYQLYPGGGNGGYRCDLILQSNGEDLFIADMNPNSSTTLGSSGFAKLFNTAGWNLADTPKYVADFNGDGKADILAFSGSSYKIISFRQLTAAPWVELEVIGSGNINQFSTLKAFLLGDYNGDGKTDIMIPTSDGAPNQTEWNIYYSNPNPAGGEFFTKEILSIVEYWPDTGSYYKTQRHWSNYYAMDINGDGKSDLVRVWRKYYKDDWSINNHDTQWQVTGFANNIGKVSGSGFNLTYDSGVFTSNSPDIPIPVPSNYRHNGANTDLLVVRGHYNKIEYYQFNKNVDRENRLKTVSESSGNIVQTIDYLPMEAVGGGLGNSATDFYSSSQSATYPNIEIIRNSGSYLVSKLTATINGVSKYQDFKYRGFVSNYNYGTVGFIKTSRSSWYLSISNPLIWTTQFNDINLRGANTITWTSTVGTTVFDAVPSNLISTKTNVFSNYTNPSSKVYNVLLDSQTTLNSITGIRSEQTFTYDGVVTSPAYYGLETKSILKQFGGSVLHGTTTIDTQHLHNPGGNGNTYYIGRPKQVNTNSLINTGDSRNSEIKYTYSGNNVVKTEKTGHNSYALIEDMTYDAVGNILSKTVSAPNAPTTVAARTVTDEYDSTKRFVIKKTDHQGFITEFTYNNLGQMGYSKNYLNVVESYYYDNWGKLTNHARVNSSANIISTNTSYLKLANGGYTTTTTNNIGGSEIKEYDVMGRLVLSTVKGLALNSTISQKIEYDGLGRKTRESEPYFSYPSRWTTYEYDYLMRPKTITKPSGRIQTFSYLALTTTSQDDTKTTTTTVNALGNTVETTDSGGSISFIYYSNGQLKESNYEGNKVSIGIDGWGNITERKDPNAGTYTYSYNAFGQLTNEGTPKGQTNITYDSLGKIIKKKLLGDGTDIETDYLYNSFGQLTSETSKTSVGAPIDVFTYGYDPLHRVISNTQSNNRFVQTKTVSYDDYGRVLTETNATQELSTGLSSSVVHKTSYNSYNGFKDKITDANDVMLWQFTTANEKMQSLTESLGNGVAITNIYDSNSYVSSQKHTKNSVDILYNTYSFNGVKGTLSNRQNLALGTSEEFIYDNMDRLTSWTNPLTGILDSNTYDNKGRITTHNKLGSISYNANLSTGIYQKTEVNLSAQGTTYYTNLPKQTVNYTMFKTPISINESDKGSTTFLYSSHLSRQTMNYGFQFVPGGTSTYSKSKNYSDDGSVEILKTPTTLTIRTYIGGNAYTAPLYIDKTMTIASGAIVEKKYYIHRDYLGSIVALSDETGSPVERRQFDAWGNLAKLQKNGIAITLPTDGTAAGLMLFDRGYTGHEHLGEVGLIHMNGRLYDPVLRTFLMPDNFIQQPENTQNYNRYAYVLNNPLLYTDRSGEEFGLGAAVIIGVAIAITSYTLTALIADVPFSVGGLVKAAVIGAASSAVTFGIGSASTALFSNFYSQASFQAVAHGTFQGGMTSISGGKFWSGFAAGALSSVASSAWGGGDTITDNGNYTQTLTQHQGISGAIGFNNSLGTIAFGTISGGAGASLTGGNFWQGAVTGLFVSGLNHFAHMIDDIQTLNEFAEERFGADFRKKYGVKSLQWASRMPKGGIYSEGEVFSYNSKTKYINSDAGSTQIGGISGNGHIYIANAFRYRLNTLYLEATLGHELIHTYHAMHFGTNYKTIYSENAAYSYSYDFYKKNNLMYDEMISLKQSRDSYMSHEDYDYKKIPGF